jgi:uncharacterized membrane protein HdeD (DUF308 family)
LCIAAGAVAFVWPDQTFVVLAGIIGWFLLFRGTFNIVEWLLVKDTVEQWWLILITGILQVAIAPWAVGYAGRSIAVLVVWVDAWALTEGVMNIWAAFRLKSVHRQAAARGAGGDIAYCTCLGVRRDLRVLATTAQSRVPAPRTSTTCPPKICPPK